MARSRQLPRHSAHHSTRYWAVAAVAALGLALAGCGKPHDEKPPTNDGLGAAAPAATTKVDSVAWNLPNEPRSLDPVKVFSGAELTVNANVCESLLTFTPDGDLKPGLATSIDTSDPTTYVVHLREGVKFSNGDPMTAQDVVFSLNRVMDPKSGSYYSGFATKVDRIEATDPSTVTITMTAPDVVFYRMLATPMGQVVQQSAAEQAGKAFGTAQGGIVCTGPYTVASWKHGDNLTVEANDNWWGLADHPLLTQQVKFTFISNDSTAASALTNGDVDGTFTVPGGAALTKLTEGSDGTLYLGPSTAQLVLVPTQLNGDSPLADPQVRQALADSIDYEGILSSIYNPTGESLRAIVPPGAFGYAKDTFQSAYDALPEPTLDIDSAKRLLAEAGQPHPSITIGVPASVDDYVNVAEAIQSNAKAAGFEVKIDSMSDADFYPLYSSAKARAKVDAFITDWFVDIPDPLVLYAEIATPGSAVDFGGYDDPEVAGLLDQARGTFDDEQRAKLVVEAQKSITEDQVWLPIVYELGTLFLSNDLGGATSASPYNLYAPWIADLGAR